MCDRIITIFAVHILESQQITKCNIVSHETINEGLPPYILRDFI